MSADESHSNIGHVLTCVCECFFSLVTLITLYAKYFVVDSAIFFFNIKAHTHKMAGTHIATNLQMWTIFIRRRLLAAIEKWNELENKYHKYSIKIVFFTGVSCCMHDYVCAVHAYWWPNNWKFLRQMILFTIIAFNHRINKF